MNKLRFSAVLSAFLIAALCAGAAERERAGPGRYFDETVIPGIDRLQEDALAAVRAADPARTGNALLMLILARDSLAPALTEERRAFLENIAVSLGLATKDELSNFRNFVTWSSKQSGEAQSWIPTAHAALTRFERHIAEADQAGKWLPPWINTIPLLPSAGDGALPPAWSWRGHAVAKELTAAAAAKPGWRATALGEYRADALAAWRTEAATLWTGIPATIPDADIPARLRDLAEGADPASRFATRAAEHLLPMFDTENNTESAPPEILWIRRWFQEQTTRKEKTTPATDAASIAEATRLATYRTAALNAAAGGNVWPTLSPLAADTYARHLLARQAALDLDATWQRTVYTPARFSPEAPEQSRARLVEFLTGPAHGFWTWSKTGGSGGDDETAIASTNLYGVPFTFSREFLAYCDAILADARSPARTEVPLTFAVASVTATGKKILERPTAVHFRLGAEDDGNTLAYNNYPATANWTWTPKIKEAAIRLTFPSRTAEIHFTTPKEMKRFVLLFGEGRCILTPEDFGPDAAPALRRLGVEEIAIAATLSNLETLLPQLARQPLPPLPLSIIPQKGESRQASKAR